MTAARARPPGLQPRCVRTPRPRYPPPMQQLCTQYAYAAIALPSWAVTAASDVRTRQDAITQHTATPSPGLSRVAPPAPSRAITALQSAIPQVRLLVRMTVPRVRGVLSCVRRTAACGIRLRCTPTQGRTCAARSACRPAAAATPLNAISSTDVGVDTMTGRAPLSLPASFERWTDECRVTPRELATSTPSHCVGPQR